MSDDSVGTPVTGHSANTRHRVAATFGHSLLCVSSRPSPLSSISPCPLIFLLFCYPSPFFYLHLFYIYWWHLGHVLNSLVEYSVVLGLSVAQGLWLQLVCSVAPWLAALGSLARVEPFSPVLQVGLLTTRPQGWPIAGAS